MKNSDASILNVLFKERPMFHGAAGPTGTQNYAITEAVLRWIFKNLEPGSVTLETGCGYSTIIFALLSACHKVISPFPLEHERIKKWCEDHGIPVGNIEFIAAISQDVIPSLFPPRKTERDLDMVLIDGCHAFPAPFIDWYYTADHIKAGGYLIVDDTQLITGSILRNFLRAEKDRWAWITDIGKTVIFQRLSSCPAVRGIPFVQQPYVNGPYVIWLEKQKKKLKTKIKKRLLNIWKGNKN